MGLEDKAKELGINVDDYKTEDGIDEDKLSEAIKEAEKTSDTKDADWLEKELKKVIDARDRAKRETRTLKEKLDSIESSTKGLPKQEEYEDLKSQFEELQKFKKEVESETEKKRLEKMDEVEREKVRFNKQLEDFKDEMEKKLSSMTGTKEEMEKQLKAKDGHISELRKERLKREISESALKYKALSPKQIVRLTESDFVYDDQLDKYIHEVRNRDGKLTKELDVEEYVKEFLELDENDNLVSGTVTVTPGPGDTVTTSKKKSDTSSGRYDPKDSKLIKEAEFRDMTVEAWIEILEDKDRIREKKKK